MPFVPVPGAAEAQLLYTLDGQKCENTLWFTQAEAWDGGSLTQLAEMVWDWWGINMAPLSSSDMLLREVTTADMSDAAGPVGAFTSGGGFGGTDGLGAAPNNVTLAVSFRTASRGRSFRGRNYIVGINKEHLTNSIVDVSYANAVGAAYTALITAAQDANYTWVVASRFSGVDAEGDPVPRAEGIATPVTSVIVVDNTVDSQRRRLPGRGQ